MDHKRAVDTNRQPTENTNIFNPHGVLNIGFSEKDVPPSHHVGSMMISSESGASSSSSHPQPIHLPDFLDKEAIGQDLLSQSLLDSVLKCTKLAVGGPKHPKVAHLSVPREMTSKTSHSQAGEDREDSTLVKVKHCVCHNGPYRYVEVLNCMIPVAVEGSGERCQVCGGFQKNT